MFRYSKIFSSISDKNEIGKYWAMMPPTEDLLVSIIDSLWRRCAAMSSSRSTSYSTIAWKSIQHMRWMNRMTHATDVATPHTPALMSQCHMSYAFEFWIEIGSRSIVILFVIVLPWNGRIRYYFRWSISVIATARVLLQPTHAHAQAQRMHFTFYLSVDRRMVSIKCHSGRYFKIFLLYSFFWLLGKLCSEREDNSIVTAFDSNRFVCICVISNACASLSLFISIFTNTSL